MKVKKVSEVLRVGRFEPTFESELLQRYETPQLPSGPQREQFLAEHADEVRVVVMVCV